MVQPIDLGGQNIWNQATVGKADDSLPYAGFYAGSSAAITAGTTQTYAGATPITTQMVRVTTGTASDGVLLPPALAGMVVIVSNASANAAKIYATTGVDTINGTAGLTGVNLTASVVTIFYCFANGAWITK